MLIAKQLSRGFVRQGEWRYVLNGLDLAVNEGEFFVILGQSGCGKSTLLRLLGGFDAPDGGSVTLGEAPITVPNKDLMMVFQSFDQLFPWFTLQKNIAYALRKTGVETNATHAAALSQKSLDEVGLGAFAKSYPHQLSGGMKQRAALARALALHPRVLLMDEPFSSLDYLTRQSAQNTLRALWKTSGAAVVLVTHDIEEALCLGQRIAILSGGRIDSIYPNDGSIVQLKDVLEKQLTVL